MKTLALLLLLSASIPALAQKQGICGTVRWVEGNQMPGPGAKLSPGKSIKREILVYELTTTNDVTSDNGFFSDISTHLVAKAQSKKSGKYTVNLPPGTYSVFVKEADGAWANTFGPKGEINPVIVNEGEFTVHEITVNYKAAY